ncbi:ADGRG4 [Branchiostoma lanceolatum]|uniref:ADGRG4 protein n=1 Tax=Branchiostoma lanceolatum TaxID=7740 RepID=A0A8J9ZND7_BRALA|nr:ADGRG4 [Branchiostoma lanceolatum]
MPSSDLSRHNYTAMRRVSGFKNIVSTVTVALVICIHSASCQSTEQTGQNGTLMHGNLGSVNTSGTVASTEILTPEPVTTTPRGFTQNNQSTVRNAAVFTGSSNGPKKQTSNSTETGVLDSSEEYTENGQGNFGGQNSWAGTNETDKGAQASKQEPGEDQKGVSDENQEGSTSQRPPGVESEKHFSAVTPILTTTPGNFSQDSAPDEPSIQDLEQSVEEVLNIGRLDDEIVTAIEESLQEDYEKYNSTLEDLDMFIEDEIHVPDCRTGFIPFGQEEWEILEPNGTLRLLLSGLHIDEEHYVRFGNFAFICNDFLKFSPNFTVSLSSTLPQGYTAQELLTLALSSLSFVSMLVFIATAVVKKMYRKIPDILKLNLTCSLLLAQTLFVFSDEIPLGGFCVFLAVLTHYMFLVAFLTMNVLAFDLFRTLGGVSGAMGFRSVKVYMCYIWSIPSLIVTISVILEFSQESKFLGYGTDICWIKQPFALVVTFVAPIGLVLASNVYFFIHTVLNITVSSIRTARARHGATYSQLQAFLKISTLMGLGWIFGFVAAGTQQDVLWYIFITLNSSQGFLISISFMTSPRDKAADKKRKGRASMTGGRNRSPFPGGIQQNGLQMCRANHSLSTSNATDVSSASGMSIERKDDSKKTTIVAVDVTAVELDDMSCSVPSQDSNVHIHSSKQNLTLGAT